MLMALIIKCRGLAVKASPVPAQKMADHETVSTPESARIFKGLGVVKNEKARDLLSPGSRAAIDKVR